MKAVILSLLFLLSQTALAQTLQFDFSFGRNGFSTEFRDIPLNIFQEYKRREQNGTLQSGPRAPLSNDLSQYPEEQSHWLINSGIFPMPDGLKRKGFLLQGNNHSDDIDMFLIRRFSVKREKTYQLRITVDLAGNAPIGAIGVGGDPELTVQAAATEISPHRFVVDSDNFVRFPDLEIGPNQLTEVNTNGVCLSEGVLGASVCPPPGEKIPFDLKRGRLSRPITIRPKSDHFWLMIGTSSGFEGLSAIYYTRVKVELNEI
jgi:hypothetical protein